MLQLLTTKFVVITELLLNTELNVAINTKKVHLRCTFFIASLSANAPPYPLHNHEKRVLLSLAMYVFI